MFFNKKITSLVIAVLASSSVVFAQNYVKTTTNSSESSSEITIGSKVLYNNSLSLETKKWGEGPALKMEKNASTLTLYNNSFFNINRYEGGDKFKSLFNVQNNGNVGIGTNNPEANLHIKGNGEDNNQLVLDGGINSIGRPGHVSLVLKSKYTSKDFIIESRTGSNHSISFSNKLYMNGGNVLIDVLYSKKVSTDYKLAVGGKILCEGVRVELQENWPDYVFQPSYELKSLEEVEQHIQKNGYLPNIPSQKEVKDNGIELGEMQRLQMEKIEELTLYLIEQNKKIELLQGQLQSLQVEK